MQAVTLEEILQAKEVRQERQRKLREAYRLPIISITINMPGPYKDSPVIRQLCDFAVNEIRTSSLTIVAEEQVNLVTGPEALVAVAGDAYEIKQVCKDIEEQFSFGRLLDLDVFSADGRLISRQQQGSGRKCLVCGEYSAICMRERRHDLEIILTAVNKLLIEFRAHQTRHISREAEMLSTWAVEAMLYEVACTPSPGLVDRVNSGAHKDMDFFTFMASSAALATTMGRCAQAGLLHDGPLTELLPLLRYIGREGEQAMLAATNGVNTQKGLLFSLGIVVAAAAWLWRQGQNVCADAVLNVASRIADGIVARELVGAHKAPHELTAGEKLFHKYGVTGIRGEIEQGLPAVRNYALPALKAGLTAGLSVNDALLHILLVLMTCVDDTTVMHRHHPDKMRSWVVTRAQEVLSAGGMYTEAGRRMTFALDEEFIAQNISPGGAADLLAVTWFLYRLEHCFSHLPSPINKGL